MVVPAGTGTTALGLARALMGDGDIVVYAVPCVGDGGYLRRQMRRLAKVDGENEGAWPVVLESGGGAQHVFARPEKGARGRWMVDGCIRSERDEAGFCFFLYIYLYTIHTHTHTRTQSCWRYGGG